MKKSNRVLAMILMQICIFLFALSNVFFKFASNYMVLEGVFSLKFILCMGGGIGVLGGYAIIWQQTLKFYDLNVANAIKTLYLLWGIIFSIFIFKEDYKLNNFIGLVLIITGIIIIIGTDAKRNKKE